MEQKFFGIIEKCFSIHPSGGSARLVPVRKDWKENSSHHYIWIEQTEHSHTNHSTHTHTDIHSVVLVSTILWKVGVRWVECTSKIVSGEQPPPPHYQNSRNWKWGSTNESSLLGGRPPAFFGSHYALLEWFHCSISHGFLHEIQWKVCCIDNCKCFTKHLY